MSELPNRADLESEFAKRFGKVARRHMLEFRELLGNPADMANVPEEFFEKMEKESKHNLYPFLLLIFSEAAIYHGWSGASMGLAAFGWANMRAESFAKNWTDASRSILNDGFSKLEEKHRQPIHTRTIEDAREDARIKPSVAVHPIEQRAADHEAEIEFAPYDYGDEPPNAQPPSVADYMRPNNNAPIAKPAKSPHDYMRPNNASVITPVKQKRSEPSNRVTELDTGLPSQDEIDKLLDKTFGPNRVVRQVIIETTSARSAGSESAVDHIGGLSENDIYLNPDDESTCLVCKPLIGTPRSIWSQPQHAPDGPPPVDSECRCRCGISYEVDRIRDGLGDKLPEWGPMEWAKYWRNPESKRRESTLKSYNASEARDESGKWTSGGSSAAHVNPSVVDVKNKLHKQAEKMGMKLTPDASHIVISEPAVRTVGSGLWGAVMPAGPGGDWEELRIKENEDDPDWHDLINTSYANKQQYDQQKWDSFESIDEAKEALKKHLQEIVEQNTHLHRLSSHERRSGVLEKWRQVETRFGKEFEPADERLYSDIMGYYEGPDYGGVTMDDLPEHKKIKPVLKSIRWNPNAWYRRIPNAAEWRAYCHENEVDMNDRSAFKSKFSGVNQ